MNKLDQYGFDWYNPPENIEIISVINLLNDAIFYRRWQGSISRNPILSVYKAFDYFILITEQLMGLSYLHPNYVNSTLNLTDRIERYNLKYNTDLNSRGQASLSLTIIDWEDLEDITGEDLSVFKDRKLRTNEVFGIGLLTKMYKVVDAFKYLRIQSGRDSHLIGEFVGQTSYTNNVPETEVTDQGISTNNFSNEDGVNWPNIYRDADNAYDEFASNLSRRSADTIILTTQILSGQPYDVKIERPPNDFRASKQWLYRARKFPEINTVYDVHIYDLNDNQRGYYGCPIAPQFSRGNSTNYYQSPTQVYSYRQEQDITNIEFYEAFCFNNKTEGGTDFGTGVVKNDGGVLPYSKNQDNTMYTGVFANFDYSSSLYPKDPNLETVDVPPNYFNDNYLKLDSQTYFNINDTDFNEYKTTSANN